LQQAYDRGFRDSFLLAIDRRMDGLRGVPAFAALERKIQDDIGRARSEVMLEQTEKASPRR
jgi:hypothetical protein